LVFWWEFILGKGKEGVQIMANWRVMDKTRGSVSILRKYLIIAWREQKLVKKCKQQLRNVQKNAEKMTTAINQERGRVKAKAKAKVWEKGKEARERVKEGKEREKDQEKIVEQCLLNVRKLMKSKNNSRKHIKNNYVFSVKWDGLELTN